MSPQVFSTLAEPNRFHIVELLRSKPRSVNEIADTLKLHQPQVSKHLKVLADAGVVNVTPNKNKHMYALKSQPFKELDTWLQKYRVLWEERFDRLDLLLQKGVIKDGRK